MSVQRSPLTPRQAGLLSCAARITSLLFDVAQLTTEAADSSQTRTRVHTAASTQDVMCACHEESRRD